MQKRLSELKVDMTGEISEYLKLSIFLTLLATAYKSLKNKELLIWNHYRTERDIKHFFCFIWRSMVLANNETVTSFTLSDASLIEALISKKTSIKSQITELKAQIIQLSGGLRLYLILIYLQLLKIVFITFMSI